MTKFLGIGQSGGLYLSDAGVVWAATGGSKPAPPSEYGTWFAFASKPDGSVLCFVSGSGATLKYATSADRGASWIVGPVGVWSYGERFSLEWNGTTFCGPSFGGNEFLTSPDGVAWSVATLPVASDYRCIAWNGIAWCSLAGVSAVSLDNGQTWSTHAFPYAATSGAINAMCAAGGDFYAVSDSGHVYRSTDNGLTWAEVATYSASLMGVAAAPDGTVLVAGYESSGSYQTLIGRYAGGAWSSAIHPGTYAFSDFAISGGVFLVSAAASDWSPQNARSSDGGLSWTLETPPEAVVTLRAVNWSEAPPPNQLLQPSRGIAVSLSAALQPSRGVAASLSATLQTTRGIAVSLTAGLQPSRGVATSLTAALQPSRRLSATLLAWSPDAAQLWRLSILVGGVDVSARLSGAGYVERTEGEPSIAVFRMLPGGGAINPADWMGQAVTIDAERLDVGQSGAHRIFTGIVVASDFEDTAQLTAVVCSDNLKAVVGRLARSAITALLPGSYYSNALSGPIPVREQFYSTEEAWAYAKTRAATLNGHLDLNAYGVPRWTAWARKTVADITFTEADLDYDALSVELSHRERPINQVRTTFVYRHPRCKVRVVSGTYTYPFISGSDYTQIGIHEYTLPTQDGILRALKGTDWDLVGADFTPPTPGSYAVHWPGGTTGIFLITPRDEAIYCIEASFKLKKRYVQTIDETWHIVTRLPGSVVAIGEESRSVSGQVVVPFDDVKWESSVNALPVVSPPGVGENWTDYYGPPTSVMSSENAVLARLVLQANAEAVIRAAHRRNYVRGTTHFSPFVDIDKSASVATSRVSCAGKVRAVKHDWDISGGGFHTSFTLAMQGVYGNGVPTEPTLPPITVSPTPPAGPFTISLGTHVGASVETTIPSASDQGYFCNINNTFSPSYRADAPVFPVKFRVIAPAIPDTSRNPLVLNTPVILDLAMENDPLEVEA